METAAPCPIVADMDQITPGRRDRRARLHGAIAEDIGIAIVRGDYRVGDALPSEDLFSVSLGVSRTAYREAIRMLAAKGLVTSRPRTGTRIQDRACWNLFDADVLAWHFRVAPKADFIAALYEVRRMLEPNAAALAARRRNADDIAAMTAALETMRRDTLHQPAGQQADLDFHQAILAATGNEPLLSLASGILATIRWTTVLKDNRHWLDRDAIPDHAAVLAAISAGDADRARAAMNVLLDHAEADMRDLLV